VDRHGRALAYKFHKPFGTDYVYKQREDAKRVWRWRDGGLRELWSNQA